MLRISRLLKRDNWLTSKWNRLELNLKLRLRLKLEPELKGRRMYQYSRWLTM